MFERVLFGSTVSAHKWSVESYRDDEVGQEYGDSYFQDIFPSISDCDRKRLIQIFEAAVLSHSTPCTAEHTHGHSHTLTHSRTPSPRQSHAEQKYEDVYLKLVDTMMGDQAEEIEEGQVDDPQHPRFQEMKGIIDGCAQMVQSGDTAMDNTDLIKLCSILDPNNVLQISDIVCRQYLIALFLNDEDGVRALSMDMSANKVPIKKMEGFIEKEYWTKEHHQEDWKEVVQNALLKLASPEWLGYLAVPSPICSPQNRLKCNARDVQIHVFGFLISSKRMLVKEFEDTNGHLLLNMKFPSESYRDDEGTLGSGILRKKSMEELQSKMIKFAEPFENHQVRGTVREQMQRHCMMIQTIDFRKPKGTKQRWNNLEPQMCGVTEKQLGFELNVKEYEKTLDKCELFQVCRAKKYLMEPTHEGPEISISLHKYGYRFRFYLHFKGSVRRIRVEDLCSWFPRLFEKWDTALELEEMQQFLRKTLRDNEKLADITNNNLAEMDEFHYYYDQDQEHKSNDKTGFCFWKSVRRWSDFDREFHQRCDRFTYQMKQQYGDQYEHDIFDSNIVDFQSLSANLKL